MSGYSIIVLRIAGSGQLVNSRPCYDCLKILQRLGLKKVHYSDQTGQLITEKIRDMVSTHQCSYVRQCLRTE